jgi:hypothetical protein
MQSALALVRDEVSETDVRMSEQSVQDRCWNNGDMAVRTGVRDWRQDQGRSMRQHRHWRRHWCVQVAEPMWGR